MTLVIVADVDSAPWRAVDRGGAVVDEPTNKPRGLRQSMVIDRGYHVCQLSAHVYDAQLETWRAAATGGWSEA
jgi:hypothetical protein